MLKKVERRWILYCVLEIVPEEFGLVMHFSPGLQPFRPSPSRESFLAPLLLDVIMKEKFREISDINRHMYLGCRYLALTARSATALLYR